MPSDQVNARRPFRFYLLVPVAIYHLGVIHTRAITRLRRGRRAAVEWRFAAAARKFITASKALSRPTHAERMIHAVAGPTRLSAGDRGVTGVRGGRTRALTEHGRPLNEVRGGSVQRMSTRNCGPV